MRSQSHWANRSLLTLHSFVTYLQICVAKCPLKTFTYLQMQSVPSGAQFQADVQSSIICKANVPMKQIQDFATLRSYVERGECASYTVPSAAGLFYTVCNWGTPWTVSIPLSIYVYSANAVIQYTLKIRVLNHLWEYFDLMALESTCLRSMLAGNTREPTSRELTSAFLDSLIYIQGKQCAWKASIELN